MNFLSAYDFDKALRKSEKENCTLTGAYDFESAVFDYIFVEINFSNVLVKNGSFSGSEFRNCRFHDVKLERVDLSMAQLFDCEVKSLEISI